MKCQCDREIPKIGPIDERLHVCEYCGRKWEVIGSGVHVTNPPGLAMVADLQTELHALREQVAALRMKTALE